MSYAIETKKRKFERVLESLTDGSNSQTRHSLTTSSNAASTTTLSSHISDASKRRRITPSSIISKSANVSTASLTAHYLPSSRLAFLERLETFRQVTKWHIPSTSAVSAVEWAKRGWICQDTDTVSCASCKERLHIDITLLEHVPSTEQGIEDVEDAEEDPLTMANSILSALIGRYQEMIVTAHTERCPWRRRGCDNSIQRIEGLLNMSTALSGLEKRYQSLTEDSTEAPEVVALPSLEACPIDEHELKLLKFSNRDSLDIDSLRLAICGWQQKENDIVECRHCFRSLGLWLYRGAQPTMEHLDPIDSHLEYCPWRSENAQDTELSITNEKGELAKHQLPGWVLVYLAVTKKNHKGRPMPSHDTPEQSNNAAEDDVQPQLTPEQRERKMKDLIKRIRDLKKPFNVKSLLRRKEKGAS